MVQRNPPHQSEKPTKRIQMQKGTDEVNEGETSYRVSLGAAEPEGVVIVPASAAEHLIRQGGAVDLDAQPDPPKGFVHVRHKVDSKASFGWNGATYEPDENGKIHAPIASLAEIEPHGFIPC